MRVIHKQLIGAPAGDPDMAFTQCGKRVPKWRTARMMHNVNCKTCQKIHFSVVRR